MREQITAILQSNPASALADKKDISSYSTLETACRISELRQAHQELTTLVEAPDHQLKAKFQQLAAQRWERIQNTAFCYSLEPDSPANSLYRQIFALLHPEASFFETLTGLMPGVNTLIYPTFDLARERNRQLSTRVKLQQFTQSNQSDLPSEVTEFDEIIVIRTQAFCVPSLPKQDELARALYRSVEEQAPQFLNRLLTHNPEIAERFEIVIAEPKTIRAAISEFAERLRLSGSKISGRSEASPLAEIAIYAFKRYLVSLPEQMRERCKTLTFGGSTTLQYVLETHLLRDGNCVEIASDNLNRMLQHSANNEVLDFKPERYKKKSGQNKEAPSNKANPLYPAGLPLCFVEENLRQIHLRDIEAQAIFFQNFPPDFYPQLKNLIRLRSASNLIYILLHLNDSQARAFLRAAAPQIPQFFPNSVALINAINTLGRGPQRGIFIEFCLETKLLKIWFLDSRLFSLLSPEQQENLRRHIRFKDFFAKNEEISIRAFSQKLYSLEPQTISSLFAALPSQQLAAAITHHEDLRSLRFRADKPSYDAIIDAAIEAGTLALIPPAELKQYLTPTQLEKWRSTLAFFFSLFDLRINMPEDELRTINPHRLNQLVDENLAALAAKKLLPHVLLKLESLIEPELYNRLIAHIAQHFIELGYNFADCNYYDFDVFSLDQKKQILGSLSDDQRLSLIRNEVKSTHNPFRGLFIPNLSSDTRNLILASIVSKEISEKAQAMAQISVKFTNSTKAEFFIFLLGLDLSDILSQTQVSELIRDLVHLASSDLLEALTAQFTLSELARRRPGLLIRAPKDIFELPRANMMRNYADFKILSSASTYIRHRALTERWLQEIELTPADYIDLLKEDGCFESLNPQQQAQALTYIDDHADLEQMPDPALLHLFNQTQKPAIKEQILDIFSTRISSYADYCTRVDDPLLSDEFANGLLTPPRLQKWASARLDMMEWQPSLLKRVKSLSDEALLELGEQIRFKNSLLAALICSGNLAEAKQVTERLNRKNLSSNQERALLGWEHAYTPLYFAVKSGDINAVEYFAEKTDRFYFAEHQTALHVATEFNHPHLITYFLQEYGKGILNLQTVEGKSALTLALEKGHEACVEALLTYEPRIEVQDLITYLTCHSLGSIEQNLELFEQRYGNLPRAKISIREFRELLTAGEQRSWAARLFLKPSPLMSRFANNDALQTIRYRLNQERHIFKP